MEDDPDQPDKRRGAGAAVDRYGTAVVDPTDNVKALNAAGREADATLRETVEKYQALLTDAKFQRVDDLAAAEQRRIDGMARIREMYDAAAADVLKVNVKTTSDNLAAQLVKETASLGSRIGELSTSFANQLSAMQASLLLQINSQNSTLSPRISELEQFRWQSSGKSSVSDPQVSEALSEMAKSITSLRDFRGNAEGQAAGTKENQSTTYVVIGLILLIAMDAFNVFHSLAPAPAPAQVTVQQPNAQGGIGIGTK